MGQPNRFLTSTEGASVPTMYPEPWNPTAEVSFHRALLNELVSLRFLDAHVAISGP